MRRQVAIKVLRPAFASDASFVSRFEFEAQAAAKLSHPNIVTTYDVGRVGDERYIVEEYVPGETLGTLIKRQGPLPEAAAVRYARQICAALAAAHRQELLHRDIKPSNVLITREDVVRVTDFGIAHAVEDGSSESSQSREAAEVLLGSLPYCAPEVLTGERISEASDLYSAGVVLYEMVTGKRPFAQSGSDELAHAIVHAPAPDPAREGASISAHLAGIIGRLLRKAPAERYQSAGEVLAALRQLMRSESEEEDGGAHIGPDAPTEILRRRTRQTMMEATAQPAKLAPIPAAPVWRASRALALAGAVVGVLVIVALLLAVRQAASRSMRVPDLAGKSVSEAVAALHAVGIDDVAIRQTPDENVAGGLIAGSEPPASQTLAPGSALTLLVSTGPPTVDVPNVLGQDPVNAQQFLAAQGFTVKSGEAIHSATVRKGLVAATNPAPGSPLGKGGTVSMSVSLGPALVDVPNIVSLTEDDARKVLAKLGLKLGINSQVAVNNIPADIVLNQDPSERGTLPPGGTVMVDVSAGPASIEVPMLVGQTLDAARQALAGVGLAIGNVAQADVPDKPAGTVVSQNPGAFARVSQGAAIDVVVAAGASTSTPQAPQPSPSAGGGQGNLPGIPVPNVIGMSVDDAKAVLERNGYRINRVIVANGSPADAKVLSTDPPVGMMPTAGNGVNLIIGR
ncbi:MAG: PASTA domain-containing protein [Candidatus Eremiobacteraeota bacterium]|nr:PASTA domain-containing protein [Candidatus Eremiobacteraeota bacterium]